MAIIELAIEKAFESDRSFMRKWERALAKVADKGRAEQFKILLELVKNEI